MSDEKNIASGPTLVVLGLGNVLSGDDGIGVRLVNAISETPLPSVECIDAGVAGLRLLNLLEEIPAILAIDSAQMDLEPGAFRWIRPGQISKEQSGNKFSLHDLGFAQTLAMAEQFFSRPATVILAIQPETVEQSDQLSATLQDAFPQLLNELQKALENWETHRHKFGQVLLETDMNKKDMLLLSCLQKDD